MAEESIDNKRNLWAAIAAIACLHLANMCMHIKAVLLNEARLDPNTVFAAAQTDAGPVHTGGQTAKSRGRSKKDKKERVRREPTKYQLFAKEQFPLVKVEDPTLKGHDVQRKVAKAWAITKSGKSGHGQHDEADVAVNVPLEDVVADEQVPAVVPIKGDEKKKKKKRPSDEDLENTSTHKHQEVEGDADTQLAKHEKKKKKLEARA